VVGNYLKLTTFFEKLLKKIKNTKEISDKIVTKITENKVFKKYYLAIKPIISEYKTELNQETKDINKQAQKANNTTQAINKDENNNDIDDKDDKDENDDDSDEDMNIDS
jgi:hypothetical protein